jgi:hypothetical protein
VAVKQPLKGDLMFKPIENTIDKNEVKSALVDWIVNDVSIDELYNAIPWNDELETLMYWCELRESIENVIANCNDNITDEPWNIREVITDTDECIRFNNFIDEKVDNILKVYGSYIERANAKKQSIAKNAQTVDDMIANSNIAHSALSVLERLFVKDYVDIVFNAIIEDVIVDVKECADEQFSDDDVRLAVNRAIVKKLGASI